MYLQSCLYRFRTVIPFYQQYIRCVPLHLRSCVGNRIKSNSVRRDTTKQNHDISSNDLVLCNMCPSALTKRTETVHCRFFFSGSKMITNQEAEDVLVHNTDHDSSLIYFKVSVVVLFFLFCFFQ